MKTLRTFSLVVIGLVMALPMLSAPKGAVDYTQYVNPYIGTGGHGHVFLGANVPNGFVQLGPSERALKWDWCSGYNYSDSILVGFSHLHLSGTGIGWLGDVTFLPVSSPQIKTLKFTHEDEEVRPGYYSLSLPKDGVTAELTATKRCGFHRYTFSGPKAYVNVNLKYGIRWDTLASCALRPVSSTLITGYRKSTGWVKNRKVYFAARFSSEVRLVNVDDNVYTLEVSNPQKPLLIKVGISAVSEENALANVDAELPSWDFDTIAKKAHDEWNEALGRIQITTSDAAARRIFYTGLYHTMVAPSVYDDVNGEYLGSDFKVHKAQGFTNQTTFSLWDTYRAKIPLMTLTYPETARDMAETFLRICDEQGMLPIWHNMSYETYAMVGNPGVIVLADLVLKGLVKDEQRAYRALKISAMKDDRGQSLRKQYGYIPFDLDSTYETVAKHLEYCIADAGVARVALKLGYKDDYEYFLNRSKEYKRLFDASDRFMKGVDSKGCYRFPFRQFQFVHQKDDYVEGNAWQYTWLVPHDVHGLVSLFPNERSFVSKLDSLFVVQGDFGPEASGDVTGLIGQYVHGNEPSHHIIYMYDYVGQPWKAARLVRKVYSEMYKDAPDGLCGNEDVGQMSAWYVISSLGLYQVDPEGGRYVFGSPLWNAATLDVGGGRKFRIVAHNNSAKNIYIQRVSLNGRNYTKSYIDYKDIVSGGRLDFYMGPKPSKFGTKTADRP